MSEAAALRLELGERARAYAAIQSLPHSISHEPEATVCFEPFGERFHGNFHPASYKMIQAHPEWRRRLRKVHTTAKRFLPVTDRGRWRELDSCMSSDALLMNVFCHPSVLRNPRLAAALVVEQGEIPQFGVRARVPLGGDKFDQTEVDMRVGNLLVEAKLTEGDFQSAEKIRLLKYRDFLEVFEDESLTQSEKRYHSYQLIRNVLAAWAMRCSMCVLLDARRPDLMEAWYAVMRCVRPIGLRTECKVLTWQELSRMLPRTLRGFLAVKYGIA